MYSIKSIHNPIHNEGGVSLAKTVQRDACARGVQKRPEYRLCAIRKAQGSNIEAPVDRARQLRQRMLKVDDRIEPGAEKKSCAPLSRRSLGRILPLRSDSSAQEQRITNPICKESDPRTPSSGETKAPLAANSESKSTSYKFFTAD